MNTHVKRFFKAWIGILGAMVGTATAIFCIICSMFFISKIFGMGVAVIIAALIASLIGAAFVCIITKPK